MRALDRGEGFIIIRNGVEVGELLPVRRSVAAKDVVPRAFQGAPSIDYRQFQADLDAILDQDITPRVD